MTFKDVFIYLLNLDFSGLGFSLRVKDLIFFSFVIFVSTKVIFKRGD